MQSNEIRCDWLYVLQPICFAAFDFLFFLSHLFSSFTSRKQLIFFKAKWYKSVAAASQMTFFRVSVLIQVVWWCERTINYCLHSWSVVLGHKHPGNWHACLKIHPFINRINNIMRHKNNLFDLLLIHNLYLCRRLLYNMICVVCVCICVLFLVHGY